MPCPTCNHTMQNVASGPDGSAVMYWCSRCGTIRDARPCHDQVAVPSLVYRTRALISRLTEKQRIIALNLGVIESVLDTSSLPEGTDESAS